MQDLLFIGGQWQPSATGATFETINPSTEETITSVQRGNAEDIDRAAHAAHAAMQGEWGEMHPAARGKLISALARAIEQHRDEIAELETIDTGKPLQQSLGDMAGSVATLDYNAGAADKLQGDSIPLGQAFVDFTWLEPLGVTAHIVPWNAPLGMAVRSMAPALTAGCTTILKPAEQSPLSALRMAQLAQEVGFPDGVINVVTGFGEEAGAPLVTHPLVRGVTFTGSVETGRLIAEAAAKTITPVVLELGGKSPMLVFSDADLDRAVEDAAIAFLANCGQVCSAATRLVVHRDIHDEFVERLKARVSGVAIGHGMDSPDLGPLVSAEQHTRVMGYIDSGVQQGARVVTGGQRPPQFERGYFVEPTIFDQVRSDMRIAQEEIFGPVVVALAFETEEEAVGIANDVTYGLASGVYTQDISRALRVARRLEAGSVWINGWFIGGVQAPTGGYKDSGIGRERGLAGIYNYVQIKNIGIKL